MQGMPGALQVLAALLHGVQTIHTYDSNKEPDFGSLDLRATQVAQATTFFQHALHPMWLGPLPVCLAEHHHGQVSATKFGHYVLRDCINLADFALQEASHTHDLPRRIMPENWRKSLRNFQVLEAHARQLSAAEESRHLEHKDCTAQAAPPSHHHIASRAFLDCTALRRPVELPGRQGREELTQKRMPLPLVQPISCLNELPKPTNW